MYQFKSRVINKEQEVLQDIESTILDNVANILDLDGYVDNCLLYDISGGAKHYQISNVAYKRLVRKAAKNINTYNK